MKDSAVLQPSFRHRSSFLWLAPLAMAALLSAGLAGTASAAKLVGKDGTVHACYKAKGKAKGSVRLVAKKGKCKRGERRVAWAVSGPTGPAGANGQAGTNGQAGADGAAGQPGPAGGSTVTTLETKVTELSSKVAALEATLSGVTSETLSNALATVNGITNAQLQEAIGSVADVSALCEQTEGLTAQANGILGSLEDTVLGGIIPLGLELLVPGLPEELPAFTC